MQEADLLIHTKLRPPFHRPGMVPRERLIARVREGLQGPLTLIVAPAGFGKSTLVAASLSDCNMHQAWLSLDREDNRPRRFLTYLVAALQKSVPQLGSHAVQLMAGMQPAPDEMILTSLVNDLDAAGEEIVLVLDDYQFIGEHSVHAAVSFLLEYCPPAFHIVIATRSDPPLPVSRLRARGRLVELRMGDLRFTASEVAQFLEEVMGLKLDPESIARLEERTEGWIAGLQMAALSMRDRADTHGFIERFSGTNRYILDYLLEEILAGQSPDIQDFLLKTSIMERMTAPLCDALLDGNVRSAGLTLEYLERENIFLIPLDERRTWFRYHHLFADLLRARLHETQPEEVPHLHLRAAAWLEKNGYILEAIQNLFLANEMDKAADLIERHGPARWTESDPSVLQMADSLPEAVLLARPKLGLYQAWLQICQGHIREALVLLHILSRHFAIGESGQGQEWMQTVIDLALGFLTPVADLHKLKPLPNDQALLEIPDREPILRDAADILYGMTLARRGEIDRAETISARWIRRGKTSGMSLAIPDLVAFLARIYFIQGRLQAAEDLCREYLDPLKDRQGMPIYNAGNLKIVLGEVFYERNCLEDAEQQIRDGLQANEPWKNLLTENFGLTALTRLLTAKGNYAEALQITEKFETRLQESSQPIEFKEELRTLRARVQLASGDIQNIPQWAERIQQTEDYKLHADAYRLTLARIRLAQGRFGDVEELLADGISPTRAGNQITRQIEGKLLLAAARAGRQRLSDAFTMIETCLALAEPERYIRIFLGIGKPVHELLDAYVQSGTSLNAAYAQKLLDAFPFPGRTTVSILPAGLVEPLSGRELEVLALMALGRTNQEIAGQLFVAPGTVKAHAASIYRKLDAANRTEAVTRARQFNLLP
jgi:LuxR family transcriptional regulator, maltose regulon positive regulatory protein